MAGHGPAATEAQEGKCDLACPDCLSSGDRKLWPQVSAKWALDRWHLVPFS